MHEEDNEERLEREHWESVMQTFLSYSHFVSLELMRRQTHINRLSVAVANRLPSITFDKFAAIENAAKRNQDFLNEMVSFYWASMGERENEANRRRGMRNIHLSQQHRNQAVLHSIHREWSAEAASERSQSFGSILKELKARLPVSPLPVSYSSSSTSSGEGLGISPTTATTTTTDGHQPPYSLRVLVPGCGTGRLAAEIAAAGYACEGNEFSAFMVTASNFLLNGMVDKESFGIFPWVENICNVVSISDTLEEVCVPDITAVDMLGEYARSANIEGVEPPYPKLSMSTGNFVDVYSKLQPGQPPSSIEVWDAVTTCFFVDTAPVVIEYVEAIYKMLKPGGIWINLGPLLYHWVADSETNNDDRYGQSIELSYEELKLVITGFGFEFLQEEWRECKYTCYEPSMMWTMYRAVFFTVRKPIGV